jgi:hypothetical protein
MIQLDRESRIEFISAFLTGCHVLNTARSQENFNEIIGIYMKYYKALHKILPRQ